MSVAQNQPVVRRVDENNPREVRTPWILCPWCDQEHATEFVCAGDTWIGHCRASCRPLEVTFEEEPE